MTQAFTARALQWAALEDAAQKALVLMMEADSAATVHADMVVHAKGTGEAAHIGTVTGIRRHVYIKLSKHDTPDGKRRYIPLEWVTAVEGNVVQLSKTAEVVRRKWLDKAALNVLKQEARRTKARKSRS